MNHDNCYCHYAGTNASIGESDRIKGNMQGWSFQLDPLADDFPTTKDDIP